MYFVAMYDGTTSSTASTDRATRGTSVPTESSKTLESLSPLTVWESISFTLTHMFLCVLFALVSLRGLYQIGRLFGTLEWIINFKGRRRFARVLKRVFGRSLTGAQRRRWTRDFFMRSRCDRMFYLIFDRIDRKKALSLFTIGNRDVLDHALSGGRGVSMAMSHHGPHHVAGMFLALSGYKVTAVRDRKEGGLRRFVQNRFDRLYPEFQRMEVLFADSYPRDIYRCLREGYIVGSAMDVGRIRVAHKKSDEMIVFGEKRPCVSGPFRIAYRCGAPVLQAFIISESGFRYRFEIAETILDPADAVDEESAVRKAISAYAANIEKYVRQTPSLVTRM